MDTPLPPGDATGDRYVAALSAPAWGYDSSEFLRRRAHGSHHGGSSPSGSERALWRPHPAPHPTPHPSAPISTGRITWEPDAISFDLIPASDPGRALFRLQKSLPTLIWNAAALEGNTFTLPQVRTLLEGVTVGGKRQAEADQILALSEGMDIMVGEVRAGTFALTKELSDRVHAAIARHEAIEAGAFRGEGTVVGGGSVRLAGGGTIGGDPAGAAGERLITDHQNLLAAVGALPDPRAAALVYFASATRSQFYFDGNKRTARIMMTGALLHAGYEPVSVPYARSEEFNVALDTLFTTDSATELIEFLTTCAPKSIA
ncbi:hypothetical protein [Mycetocola tolaasinivorans]|uniref:hypothetical protein n=1 Tax=Mycetocola tolaasinivorans TaxID=76635 RepID=UPI001C7E00EB|nr:hypothetical protein [Mycetocola tolaasinivorans]